MSCQSFLQTVHAHIWQDYALFYISFIYPIWIGMLVKMLLYRMRKIGLALFLQDPLYYIVSCRNQIDTTFWHNKAQMQFKSTRHRGYAFMVLCKFLSP